MDQFDTRREARRQLALERLGSDHPACPCGETDPSCLQLTWCPPNNLGEEKILIICRNCRAKQNPPPKSIVKVKRNAFCIVCLEDDARCLELHHIAGRKFADDVVVVCCNCHGKLSDMQKDHEQ